MLWRRSIYSGATALSHQPRRVITVNMTLATTLETTTTETALLSNGERQHQPPQHHAVENHRHNIIYVEIRHSRRNWCSDDAEPLLVMVLALMLKLVARRGPAPTRVIRHAVWDAGPRVMPPLVLRLVRDPRFCARDVGWRGRWPVVLRLSLLLSPRSTTRPPSEAQLKARQHSQRRTLVLCHSP